MAITAPGKGSNKSAKFGVTHAREREDVTSETTVTSKPEGARSRNLAAEDSTPLSYFYRYYRYHRYASVFTNEIPKR